MRIAARFSEAEPAELHGIARVAGDHDKRNDHWGTTAGAPAPSVGVRKGSLTEQGTHAERDMTVRPGTAIGVDPEFLSTAAGSVISRSMLLPVPP